ncbi:hypothetical protein ACIRRA_41305 [Nocardia sp. NPDC101769]|uniref:DUF6630 family protein n=1 Tax=Nocardia sp. NPDC101769 TaxID=3364333 RepID=UPI00381E240C
MILTEGQHAALLSIIELLAPDLDTALTRLSEELENGEERELTPEEVMMSPLSNSDMRYIAHPAAFAFFDYTVGPNEVRDDLQRLHGCPPGLNWDWYDEGDEWGPRGHEDFFWSLARRCQDLQVAVVSVCARDDYYGFDLGFVPSDRLDRLMDLALRVGARIEIVRPDEPMPTISAVFAEVKLDEWDEEDQDL